MELIARIGEGDRKAFEELYNLYHRRMARFLTRLTRRYDIAEEVINDTFWVVWRKARTFRGDSQPSTWIFGIAYRKARNAFRASARLAEQNLEATELPLTTESSRPAPRSCATGSARRSRSCRSSSGSRWSCATSSATPARRSAVIMNCPVNTVKTRLFHARAKLQKLLPQLAQPTTAAAAGPLWTEGAMMGTAPSLHEEMLAAAAVARQRPARSGAARAGGGACRARCAERAR